MKKKGEINSPFFTSAVFLIKKHFLPRRSYWLCIVPYTINRALLNGTLHSYSLMHVHTWEAILSSQLKLKRTVNSQDRQPFTGMCIHLWQDVHNRPYQIYDSLCGSLRSRWIPFRFRLDDLRARSIDYSSTMDCLSATMKGWLGMVLVYPY